MWSTSGVLVSAGLVLLALACASAWLSYHARVACVFSRNGEGFSVRGTPLRATMTVNRS